jgi:hypothetical protein
MLYSKALGKGVLPALAKSRRLEVNAAIIIVLGLAYGREDGLLGTTH